MFIVHLVVGFSTQIPLKLRIILCNKLIPNLPYNVFVFIKFWRTI